MELGHAAGRFRRGLTWDAQGRYRFGSGPGRERPVEARLASTVGAHARRGVSG